MQPETATELDRMFREVVLVLGGVFAVRRTDNETICQIARGLERIYRRSRRKKTAGRKPTSAPPPKALAHPAIAGLLQLIDAEENRT